MSGSVGSGFENPKMRKKAGLVLFFTLIALNVFALTYDTDIKQRSMALSGIADCTSETNFYKNPAGLYLNERDNNFVLSVGYSDEIYVKSEFVGQRISFAINVDNQEKNINDLQRDVIFSFNAAAGFDYLGLGVGIYGGSSMEQSNVTNRIYQSIFGDYIRIEDSQFVNIRIGAMYRLSDFTFGLMADRVLTYQGYEEHLSVSHAFDYISGGAYWNQSKYAKRGRLNKWVFSAGVETLNIFNNNERALAYGAEATIQLANDYSVSFRGGMQTPLFNTNQVFYSAGLGIRVGQFDLGGYIVIPGANFKDSNSDVFNFNISFTK